MPRQPSIVFLNRFYWPDVAATGQMLTDLAEDLAAAGWDVTVVASRTHYAGKGRLPRREERNGVRIIRVRTTRFGRHRTLARLGDSLSYLSGAFLRLLRGPRPDVIAVMSDPPFLLAPAVAAAAARGGVPVVYWVQDVYPHLAQRLGALRDGGLAYRALDRLARGLHARCDTVITLGERMAGVMRGAGARPDAVACVPNWIDGESLRPVPREENPFARELGLDGKFVVLYSGNAGRAHTFGAVLEAAGELRAEDDVEFIFIGGGRRYPELRRAARERGLDNMRFLDYLPRERLRYSFSAADAALVTEKPEAAGLLVPSKTYGIMASARPLLFVGSERSDVTALVRETGCGLVIPPDRPDELVAAILRLRAEPEYARVMGARGRRAVETTYGRRHATRRWAEVVEGVLNGRGPRACQATAP